VIPNAQYTEINIKGRKGNVSPRMRGCRNWPHVSTATRPSKYPLPIHPISNLPSSDVDSSLVFCGFSSEFGDFGKATSENKEEKPNHITRQCRSSNVTLIGYSCASNKRGKRE